MSGGKDHNVPEQEMPGLPGNEHIDADVEDEDLQSLLQNHVHEQNPQFQTAVNFISDSGFAGNSLEPCSVEQNIKETAIPSELQTGAEAPISMKQTDDDLPGNEVPVLMNQRGNDSEKPCDEVPAFVNQTENDSEKSGDQVPVSMNQIQIDSEKTGDGDPISLNQTENDSEKTGDEVPFFMNQKENDSEQNGAFSSKTGMEVDTPLENGCNSLDLDVQATYSEDNHSTQTPLKQERAEGEQLALVKSSHQSFTFDHFLDGYDSGTKEEQAAFMKELENFFRERSMEFKPPRFYGKELDCLKLWRAVTKLGGYDRVSSCKLWRQVGESFKPPKTCTTVSWSFRCYYEKALLEYEKHKIRTGELQIAMPDFMEAENQGGGNQSSSLGMARRDAAARAMQERSPYSIMKRGKPLKSIGAHKRKNPSKLEPAIKVARTQDIQTQESLALTIDVGFSKYNKFWLSVGRVDTTIVDIGAPADWVKINVQQNKDCFEVYALVPGLLREEVQVLSDPAGRLIISGEPEQPDNPWGVTPFKKVITLPSRIDPHKTSAVVTLHGQLFIRAPFDQSDL